jgi:putative transport protein
VILRKNLADEARALADTLGAGDEETTSPSLPVLVERAFEVGELAGETVEQFERTRNWTVAIESVMRDGTMVKADLGLVLEPGDVVYLRGRRNTVIAASKLMGKEVVLPPGSGFTMGTRDVILQRKEVYGKQARQLRDLTTPERQRGIFLTRIRRMGHNIPALPKTLLQQGDVLTIYGPEDTIDQAVGEIGSPLPSEDNTDFVFLGLGVFVGLILGHLSARIGAVELTLGLGGGALVSGLFFGWLNTRFPAHGALPQPAAHFAKDFGLATFIAAIGLGAGPDAIAVIREYGLLFPVLGILLSALPALASLLVGAWMMRVPMPILLGAIAGQHCSTPGLSAVVNIAGNTTPVIGYTVTYAISNVLLPLMGPVVVALAHYAGSGP